MLICEFNLAHEPRVSLSQYRMSVPGDYLARRHSFFDIVSDILFSPLLSVLFLEVKQELQAFLVCKPVQRTSKPVHTCSQREIGV